MNGWADETGPSPRAGEMVSAVAVARLRGRASVSSELVGGMTVGGTTAMGGMSVGGTTAFGGVSVGGTTASTAGTGLAGGCGSPDAIAFQVVATGSSHTCVLTATGAVRCWGRNDFGQLGDGTTTHRSSPSTGDVLSGIAGLAAGVNHTCALMKASSVRCWGNNLHGELGLPPPDHSTPKPVVGIC